MAEIISLGDCNTLGIGELRGNSYPERLGKALNMKVDNRGFTMSTTREGLRIFRDHSCDRTKIVTIQFGLVDSWKTFRYSPYVLYYPDNLWRKFSRKVVKKYKKICKNAGCNKRLGVKNVVPPEEYIGNINTIIDQAFPAKVFLLDTVPHRDASRNPEIIRYNSLLSEISNMHPNVYRVKLFDIFLNHMDDYYLDDTHISDAGYRFITSRLLEMYKVSAG
jgi:lysophospholipase L1-like esterase